MRTALALVALTACVRHGAPVNLQAPRSPPERFEYGVAEGFVLATAASESTAYETAILTYPAFDRSDLDNPFVRAELRRPKKSRGLILVLPILGDDYGPSNAFAEDLAERGFATLRFDRKENLFDPEKDFAHVARSIRNSVIDVRRSLDWRPLRAIVSRGVGIVGISMGSFVATGVAATDPRVDASVLALGGAGLVDILYAARSEPEIGRFFEALERRGWSDERIRREAHLHLDPLDPERFAGALDPRATLLVHARFDAVVPYHHGTRLWRAAGKPERITLLSGHYTAAFYLPWLQKLTADHFFRHLH